MHTTSGQSEYEMCHQLMLAHPKYVPTEGQEVTYLLMQISETDDHIGICGHIIDPAVPSSGSPVQFLRLPLHKQMLLFSLDKINGVLRDAHKFLEMLSKLRKPDETEEEFIERVKAKLEASD